MPLSVGIVGLPNVGKSTVFNALTAGKAEAANYPFCTIDPNVGVVPVPDPRLQQIQKHIKTQKVIPAIVEIVDIAGLVKGASSGEGLGNKFLANIRETSAILMMVRCFDDENVIHVAGSVDPMRDIDIIELELALADAESAEKRVKKTAGIAKTGGKEAKAEAALAEKVFNHLNAGKAARTLELTDDERKAVTGFGLLTFKPVLYCCNVGEGDLPKGNAYSDLVRARAEKEGAGVVILCGKVEAELALIEKVHAQLTAGKAVRGLALTDDEKKQVATFGLLTTKPVLYCCNVGESDLPNGNAWSDTVRARAKAEGAGVVILCGKVESELAEVGEEDRGELLASYGLTEPALATLARECYRLLGLQSYFTAGEKEIRAWTVRKGALAPEAAGVIHTDV